MFIVWGSRGFEKDLGETIVRCTCGNCNNDVAMEAKQIGRKFTLFWIPLFTTSSAYYMLCPICHHGKEMTKAMIDQYLVATTEPTAE
ncbi:zinc-ribbon domain-containing protein [uncultured Enterococcus sp.]|uniref:zinc-ribbon domain-containing protein n=1 Tax=uncultured Enterococcus sp. TaxID=167972 RepID=UPI002AA72952|nr:zinc-ribbon domain-containing protein [uncultured Enterococcus sp.]